MVKKIINREVKNKFIFKDKIKNKPKENNFIVRPKVENNFIVRPKVENNFIVRPKVENNFIIRPKVENNFIIKPLFYRNFKLFLKNNIITEDLLTDIQENITQVYKIKNIIISSIYSENLVFLFDKDKIKHLEFCYGYKFHKISENIISTTSYMFIYIQEIDLWILGRKYLLDNILYRRIIMNELIEYFNTLDYKNREYIANILINIKGI